MNYDGLLFGNGMTLNLLYKLRPYIPEEKLYLLNIDTFLQKWIQGTVSFREENMLYTAIYGNQKNMQKQIELIKKELNIYFQTYTSDIEYFLGATLFETKDNNATNLLNRIKILFPALYNIWYIILMDYLQYQKLDSKIIEYYDKVKKVTGIPQYIWTTNFDLFAEPLKPKHIHGRFLQSLKHYEDVVYHNFENHFYYKYIWGHNGIGKMDLIKKLQQYPDYSEYFDFDFFLDESIAMDNLLIYGMGFKNSGYISQLNSSFSKYNKPAFGGIIDEHILTRILGLQESGKLNRVDITYFDENEKKHLQDVLEACKIKNYNLKKCQDFDFKFY